MPSVLLIGAGNVGSALVRKAQKQGWSVDALTRKGLSSFTEDREPTFCAFEGDSPTPRSLLEFALEDAKPDIAFLAIPGSPNGSVGLAYILDLTQSGIPVVTAEKSAFAHHYQDLAPLVELDMLGIRATVGGGTAMLDYLRARQVAHKEVLGYFAVNGTLNFLFTEDGSFAEKVERATKLGYAEPGATDPAAVVAGELNDVRMKASILFNHAFGNGAALSPDSFHRASCTTKDLRALTSPGVRVRYLVRITNSGAEPEIDRDSPGSLFAEVDGWTVHGGFYPIAEGTPLSGWSLKGVDNGFYLEEGPFGQDGTYRMVGNGAGPEPTAESMMCDARRILGI